MLSLTRGVNKLATPCRITFLHDILPWWTGSSFFSFFPQYRELGLFSLSESNFQRCALPGTLNEAPFYLLQWKVPRALARSRVSPAFFSFLQSEGRDGVTFPWQVEASIFTANVKQ